MKKTLITISSIIAGLVIILIISYIFISTILGSIITSTIGQKTTITNTVISSNNLRFWGLKIYNPPHTQNPYALTVGKIQVVAPLSAYFKHTVKIDTITLSNLTLTVEILPGNNQISNWDEIISHMSQSDTKSSKKTRNTSIKLLLIKNLTVKVIAADGSVKVTKIQNLTFRNLSTKKGNITNQIVKTIIMRMIFNVKNIANFSIKFTNKSFNNFFDTIKKDMQTIFPKK